MGLILGGAGLKKPNAARFFADKSENFSDYRVNKPGRAGFGADLRRCLSIGLIALITLYENPRQGF